MYLINELNNGIKVVMEKVENINSISLGVIIENGSSNEDIKNSGISHFIEHMLFRGTTSKSSKDISNIIDNIGGNLNAFTGRENTCFYVQILKSHLDIAIELLSDMILNPTFEEEDILKEKKIINEEIDMYLDDSEDLVHELLNSIIYSGSSLSLPILGNAKTINSFNKEKLVDYYKEKYIGKKIIISIAGNIEFDEINKKIKNAFEKLPKTNGLSYLENVNCIDSKNFSFNNINSIKREIEQFNLCIGFPGPSISSEDIYPYMVLTNLFVNNDSSKLSQSIREEGLAYSLYSSISSYKNTGDISIYLGLNNKEIKKVLSIIDKEIIDLNKNIISNEELLKGKEQLKINYILENEDSLSKMFENAKSVSLFDKIESQDEIIRKIDNISRIDISEIINESFQREKLNLSYISNLDKKLVLESYIKKNIFRSL